MNKTELVESIARNMEAATKQAVSIKHAGLALNAVIECITQALSSGEEVRLVGFGTFSVAQRKALKGRNPSTGAPIDLAPSTNARFKAGKGLKAALNEKT